MENLSFEQYNNRVSDSESVHQCVFQMIMRRVKEDQHNSLAEKPRKGEPKGRPKIWTFSKKGLNSSSSKYGIF